MSDRDQAAIRAQSASFLAALRVLVRAHGEPQP